jgi:hypothetical protein
MSWERSGIETLSPHYLRLRIDSCVLGGSGGQRLRMGLQFFGLGICVMLVVVPTTNKVMHDLQCFADRI